MSALSSGILLPESATWNDGYESRFKVAAAGDGFLDVLCLGDSTTAGTPNPTTATQDAVGDSYAGMIYSGLLSLGLDAAARFWSTLESLSFEADLIYTSLARGGAPWTVNNAVTQQAGWARLLSSTTTGAFPANISHTYLSDPAARALRFFTATYTTAQQSAKYSHRIDGGAAVQHTLRVAASDGGVDYLDLTGLSPAIHTVDFGAQLAADGTTPQANTLYLLGCTETYNPSHGLRWGRAASSGEVLGRWSAIAAGSGGASPADKFAHLLGGYDGTSYNTLGFPATPDLCVIHFGLNDCNRGVANFSLDPRSVYHALTYAAQVYRRAKPAGTLVFVVPYLPPPSGDVTSFTVYLYDWPLYRRAIRQAAQDANAACVDLTERWGSTAFASGYMSAANIHPLRAGNVDTYSAIMEALAA